MIKIQLGVTVNSSTGPYSDHIMEFVIVFSQKEFEGNLEAPFKESTEAQTAYASHGYVIRAGPVWIENVVQQIIRQCQGLIGRLYGNMHKTWNHMARILYLVYVFKMLRAQGLISKDKRIELNKFISP